MMVQIVTVQVLVVNLMEPVAIATNKVLLIMIYIVRD